MIDVHDMMVGNWYHDDKYDAITTLTPNLAYQHILNTCSGIPVTKEILKNIGFKEEKALVSLYQYWDGSNKYKLNVDEYYTNGDRRWYVQIDNNMCRSIGCGEFTYVHELQNLVRVITGRDLPITKEMLYGNMDKDKVTLA